MLVRAICNEILKNIYKKIFGEENADKYKKVGWSVASGSAEVIADLLLCPWEAVKLKIQFSRPGHEYPTSLIPALNQARATEGWWGGKRYAAFQVHPH
jgi:solute carrier family 25 (mitochondrial phosphate transporter), member 3